MTTRVRSAAPPDEAPGRSRRRGGRGGAVLLLLLVLSLLPSCSGGSSASAPGGSAGTTAVVEPAPVDFSRRGPYPVGTLTVPVGATTAIVYYPAEPVSFAASRRRTSYNTADAYAPALRDAVTPLVPELALDIPQDVAQEAQINHEGPFPIVVHSHGTGGDAHDQSLHLQHLASWGFVTAAPEHTSRDVNALAAGAVVGEGNPDVMDLAETLRVLAKENTRPGSPLLTGLDTTSVAAEGLDAGGRAAYLWALSEPKVKLWIGQAPIAVTPTAVTPTAALPPGGAADDRPTALGRASLVITGEVDTLVPLADVQSVYDGLSPPKRMAVVKGAGHASFVDACAPVQRAGGLGRYAATMPALVPLLERRDDGCGPGTIDPAKASAYIDHLTVAQYRYVLGLDASDVSLRDAFLQRTFPEAAMPVQAVLR